MKKNILNLGTQLNRIEQQTIKGSDFDNAPLGECLEPGTFPPVVIARVPCNQKCPNGLTPFCFATEGGELF
ncbi:conserved protein of unknown function [Tenacibaculum sp. 190130A14a]|uniref:Uncharacterized protein n=1 Tax=Tenacibaculum polynesiense TaxID=3137857 RepID=A0ABP1ESF1_9FLAO